MRSADRWKKRKNSDSRISNCKVEVSLQKFATVYGFRCPGVNDNGERLIKMWKYLTRMDVRETREERRDFGNEVERVVS